MVHPIQEILKYRKDIVMEKLREIMPELDMNLVGYRQDLGLMSIKPKADVMLYAHIVELSDEKTKISIAPGLPYLKECNQSEIPESRITKILQKLQIELEN